MGSNNGNQARCWQLADEGLTQSKIAAALGISRSSVRTHLKARAKQYLGQGVVPSGVDVVKGTMHIARNEAGEMEVLQAWPRCEPSQQALEDLVTALCERVDGKGRVGKYKARKSDRDDMLGEIDIYDPHVGMYAAERITRGSDYNCDIAAREMLKATEYIAGRFGRLGEVVVVFGGDIIHADNSFNQTTSQSHTVDVDTRYQRVIEYAEAACVDAIQVAARVAKRVRVVVCPGNHDRDSCKWLTRVLNAYWRREKRVTVDLTHYHRKSLVFGDNLLAWTHGDRISFSKWAQIIAAEMAANWGKTRHRYLYLGHVHHKKAVAPVVSEEQAGLHVEYLPALCPVDDWHASAGFVGSQKGASGFEYHARAGRVSRFYYNSEL